MCASEAPAACRWAAMRRLHDAPLASQLAAVPVMLPPADLPPLLHRLLLHCCTAVPLQESVLYYNIESAMALVVTL
jgi:hypothetical protein